MREADVIFVATVILGDDFPVAGDAPALRPEQLRSALAMVENDVEVPCHITKESLEGAGIRIEVTEDEALVRFDTRDRRETPFALVDLFVINGIFSRHVGQAAVAVIGPAMVAALEPLRSPPVFLANLIAAMTASVKM